jgi:hypothetical protein
MSREELEQVDDRGMTAWDSHDTEAWLSLFGDEFVLNDWTLPAPIRDKEGVRQYFNAWMTAFPDMRVKQTNRVVGGDAVAAEIEFVGTNTGPMVMAGNESSRRTGPCRGAAPISRTSGAARSSSSAPTQTPPGL